MHGHLSVKFVFRDLKPFNLLGVCRTDDLQKSVTSIVPAASSVHYTASCKHSLALPRMGEIIARNRLS